MSLDDSSTPSKKPKKIKPDDADGHRDRMRHRLFNAVNHVMPPRDVLEMLLFYVIRISDTRDIAVALMRRFRKNLRAVFKADPNELLSFDGIGQQSVIFLKILSEVTDRLRSPMQHSVPVVYPDSDSIVSLFTEHAASITNDESWIAYFNLSHRLIAMDKLTDGPIVDSNACLSRILQSEALNAAQYLAFLHIAPDSNLILSPAEVSAFTFIRFHFDCVRIKTIEYVIVSNRKSKALIKEDLH